MKKFITFPPKALKSKGPPHACCWLIVIPSHLIREENAIIAKQWKWYFFHTTLQY